MSDVLRVALVAEGVTDYEFISAAVEAMLGGRSFNLKLLQPEGSVAFTGGGDAGPLGGGWKGVYKWCSQAVQRSGGKLSDDPLFITYDLLLLHVDADVAGEDPANDRKNPLPQLAGMLPCKQPCPPAGATTEPLRNVLLAWIGETTPPPNTVFCIPSKSTEAWVMAICFPGDKEMQRQDWECHPKPENRLGQQPHSQRFAKTQADYEKRKPLFQAGWPSAVARLAQARRFQDEFMAALSAST